MAVAQASQPKCAYCEKNLEDFVARQICPACRRPQPVLDTDHYFSVFGLEFRFHLDRSELENRFLKISRLLHPDRFSTSGADDQKNSLKRMGYLNQAYQTLKNADLLREYFFKYFDVKPQATDKSSVPSEIAESWFDLQDDMSLEKVRQFRADLNELKSQFSKGIALLEHEIDQELKLKKLDFNKMLLQKLLHLVHRKNYLESLERDIERHANRSSS